MTRSQLEHAIRAACDVSGDTEVWVFGSQAIASLSAGWLVYAMGWEGMLSTTLPFMLALTVLIFVLRRRF